MGSIRPPNSHRESHHIVTSLFIENITVCPGNGVTTSWTHTVPDKVSGVGEGTDDPELARGVRVPQHLAQQRLCRRYLAPHLHDSTISSLKSIFEKKPSFLKDESDPDQINLSLDQWIYYMV